MRTFGIDLLSVFALPPLDFVRLAAELGRPTISMALAPFAHNPEGYPAWSLRADAQLRRDLRRALADYDVTIGLGDGFVVMPGYEVRDAFERDMALMAELEVSRLCVVSFDPDHARTLDAYAETAALAATFGLKCVVEFAPCFPSTPDLASALAAKNHVGRDDFRLLIDTMHLVRSGGTAADIARLPPNTVSHVQICDAPRSPSIPDYITEAMSERRPPGEGDLPLLEIVSAFSDDVTFSIEIPLASEAAAGVGPQKRMARAVAATSALMEAVAQHEQKS